MWPANLSSLFASPLLTSDLSISSLSAISVYDFLFIFSDPRPKGWFSMVGHSAHMCMWVPDRHLHLCLCGAEADQR